MVQFYRVIMDPVGTVSYHPKNDLAAAFRSRWINSVNLFVGALDVELQLMRPYRRLEFFNETRLFCGEWHHRPEPSIESFQKELLQLSKAPGSELFIGVSFFQY